MWQAVVVKQKKRALRKHCSVKFAGKAVSIKIHKSLSHLEICSEKTTKKICREDVPVEMSEDALGP